MDVLKTKVSEECYDALTTGGINSLKVLLTTSDANLHQLTRLNSAQIKQVIEIAAEIVIASKFTKALNVPPWKRISTGCAAIDEIIRGGIPVNGITEIVGPSGVGKSQFCLQLALMAQFPEEFGGVNKGVLYICTEDAFPSKRLTELSEKLPQNFKHCTLDKISFKDNVFVEHLDDFEQLRFCLYERLPKFLRKSNIGLIVIDSIAAVFRSENLEVDYVKRSQEFHVIANKLLELGTEYQIAVVCTNQVTDDPDSRRLEPCLGLAWRNVLTCRFSLSRFNASIREFSVDFAPDLPHKTCQFMVKENGVISI